MNTASLEELDKLLCNYSTLREMKDESPTAWNLLLTTLSRREETIKQREVDLTIVNLVDHGLFTPGDLARVVNESILKREDA